MLPEWIENRIKVESSKADLKGADLSHQKLMQAKLDHANLEEADLSYSYLLCADLRGANLREADLTSAVLSEADLNGADLTDAEFTDAYLHGADLRNTINLTCDQLELAYLDKTTQLPDTIQLTWTSDTTFTCHE
ncbi:MAG: pentapeptide repeat-containing protein [Nitrospina sp.]|nr:MAG: pentapeptide repeat-containing protein [Nitrospina sp.]